jgi:hypothetical protein
MLISSPGPCDGNTCPERNPGLFLGPMRGDMVRIADGQFFTFYYRNGLLHRFILSSYDNDAKETTIIGVSSEGNVDTLGVWKNYPHISLSPDSRWMAVTDGGNMTLFDESDRIAYVFNQGLRTDIAWKTNSQGLFVKTDREVYYLPATDPVPELLFECDSPECNPKGKIYLLPGIYVSSLPNLRTRPPAVDNPSEGKSFWSAVEYRDLAQPGTNEYSADIPAHAERRWNFSWCATTAEGLAQALSPLDIEFLIGGQKVGEDAFRIYDRAEGGWQCRTWAILTAGWQPGDQTDLEIRYTLRQSVSDGKTAYPAGEYRQIIHVAVT